jgi:hypothetical protein
MPLPFEQQPRESDKAFAAFSLYLSEGPQRSLAAVAQKLNKSVTMLGRWSAKFDWSARVQAHAAHLAIVEREATEALTRGKAAQWVTRQEEHREEEWKMRSELIELAREAIARWKKAPQRCGTLEGIARLLDLASKLGRLSSGMPTDRTEVSGELTATLKLEFVQALDEVYGKTVDVEVVEPKALLGGKP